MKKNQKYVLLFLLSMLCFLVSPCSYAQENLIPVIKFKGADIRVVLQSIAEKAIKDGERVNIVTSPNVQGLVSVNLANVDWQTALKVILDAYNFAYKWIGDNIILVATLEEIMERETQDRERQEVEVRRSKVFILKFIDANDAKKAIQPILSPVGKASALETTGQAGWEFGTEVTKRERAKEGSVSRTKILLVSDISSKLDEVEQLLAKIDVMPQQILIRAKVMEVNRDLLRDIGFDWGIGTTGAESTTLAYTPTKKKADGSALTQIGGQAIAPQPGGFAAKTSALTADYYKLVFQKLAGSQFEVILHALEEDARTNTLSAPSILTMNNQEASILVGTKYPIVKTEVSTETNQITGGSLEEYMDIGIQLNVVPQICGENDEFINMIVHPAVTSYSSTVAIRRVEGTGDDAVTTTLVEYPIIISREAETQVMIADGETIVIGGLLKDIKTKYEIGVPFLSKIPLLGWFFKRTTYDTEKIDLLIFITAKIVKPGEDVPQDILDIAPVTSKFEKK